MTDTQILDTFYNKFVPEARKGRVDCYFITNIIFNLTIDNKEVSKCTDLPCDGILVPTLKVTNKKMFDDMLIKYVRKALEFYDSSEFSFLNDLNTMNIENLETVKEEYLIKYVISTLFANASLDDFNSPIEFLHSRIAMFDNKILDDDENLDLGYIDSIGAKIYVVEEKAPIKTETPYRIKCYLQFDDGYKLLLPEIYAANNGDKYKLYAIQKTTKNGEIDERPYLRQIRNGFSYKIKGAPEHYFLAVMLFMSMCSDKEIEVVPFLLERWNAKRIALFNKSKRDSNYSLLDIDEEQEKIQNNVTDIFIRYFTKLEDVSKGLDFYMMPFETDSSLHININQDFESKSAAFNELFKLTNEYKSKKNNFGR